MPGIAPGALCSVARRQVGSNPRSPVFVVCTGGRGRSGLLFVLTFTPWLRRAEILCLPLAAVARRVYSVPLFGDIIVTKETTLSTIF